MGRKRVPDAAIGTIKNTYKLCKISSEKVYSNKGKQILYYCKCLSCGKTRALKKAIFLSRTPMCGCPESHIIFRRQNYIGEVFGSKKVLKELPSSLQKESNTTNEVRCRRFKYKCLICGSKGDITRASLLASKKIRGCLACRGLGIRSHYSSKATELINKKFGLLTVKKYTGSVVRGKSKRRMSQYCCYCDCGNKVNVVRDDLTGGKKTSCGCKKTAGYAYQQYIGKKSFRLTILDIIVEPGTPQDIVYFKVRCDCGKEKVIRALSILQGRVKSCGCIIGRRGFFSEKDLNGFLLNSKRI